MGRLFNTFLVLALSWGSWVPCVCSVAPREAQAGHCSAHDGGDEGLWAGPSTCCCNGAAVVQAPSATVTRQAFFVDTVLSQLPAPVPSFTQERPRLESAAVVAASPPPRLIALRI